MQMILTSQGFFCQSVFQTHYRRLSDTAAAAGFAEHKMIYETNSLYPKAHPWLFCRAHGGQAALVQ